MVENSSHLSYSKSIWTKNLHFTGFDLEMIGGRKLTEMVKRVKTAASAVFLDTAARRIREMRAQRGMTRRELAKKCGVSLFKMARMECNLAKIDIHTCERLGKALDVSWLYLVGLVDEKKPVSYDTNMFLKELEIHFKD